MAEETAAAENPAREQGGTMVSEQKRNTGAAAASGVVGPLWFWGWLYTIGFAKLVWWQTIFALVIWPYYLGVAKR